MARTLRAGIDIRSNWLYVDRALLAAEGTSPEQLRRTLEIGAAAIETALDELYERTVQRNPGGEIHYPWLQTIRLCALGDEPRILTDKGLEPPYTGISKTVHDDPADIIPTLRPYWDAASEFEVRALSHMQGWDDAHDGTWLQVRPSGKD